LASSFEASADFSMFFAESSHKEIVCRNRLGSIKENRYEKSAFSEAAALPLTTITAWEMLFDRLRIGKSAEGTLLILGGAGGVGSIATQLASRVGNFSRCGYVEALILGTPKDQLNGSEKPKKPKGVSPEDVGRLKEEMVTLERDLKAIEAGYGDNVLNLTIVRAYVRKLLNNPAVAGFMSNHHADILAEFTALVATESL
jgi:hypothetical protein